VIPTSRGGSDKPDNTVASCANCNVVKGNMTGDEFRRYMSDRNKYRGLKSAHWRNA
jgi:5-methylcytosine-specific restriction endonuclease McrA